MQDLVKLTIFNNRDSRMTEFKFTVRDEVLEDAGGFDVPMASFDAEEVLLRLFTLLHEHSGR